MNDERASLSLARQQLAVARQQAIALVAAIDAALGSLPQDTPEPQRKRPPVLGGEGEGE